MNELSGKKAELVFNLLGLARRCGKLLIGQDRTLAAVRMGTRLLVITSNDAGAAVMRSLSRHEEDGSAVRLTIKDADRTSLGGRVGIASAQIVALPQQDGFAKKILKICEDRGDADE